ISSVPESYMAPVLAALPCFFFFQAEDGIRDFHVTGVQTCALPISAPSAWPSRAAPAATVLAPPPPLSIRVVGGASTGRGAKTRRSEERRVGKECRARWSRYEEKETKRALEGG